ncbi:exported hypothetical protein [Magnetospirillum sp. LM-5]|uniref:substrate-binding periplasmic protein n=1 Tax=Magnetospirillum sp. LM-5 TaxID=2681466 RepID=UPI00137CCAA7|nr:transporter substrate-binding domain-containing protein [Magnetospirillum sp. LM-5]CAA7611598.1 exported hypothetical protein [Magnetospirillum sp. LM-5]
MTFVGWRAGVRVIAAGLVGLWLGAASAAETATVTIGVYPYPPFGYVADGRHTGYAYDMIEAVVRRAGFAVAVEEVPVMRAVVMLRESTNLLIMATKTAETVARYEAHWPFCFETVTHALLMKKATRYSRLEDLPRDTVIGAFLGYTLKTHLAELGFTDIQFASENGQVADMLLHGRVEAWASFESAAYYLLEAKGVGQDAVKSIPVQRFPFCVMASRNTSPDILARLHAAAAAIEADGTRAAIRARYARYLGPDLPLPAKP